MRESTRMLGVTVRPRRGSTRAGARVGRAAEHEACVERAARTPPWLVGARLPLGCFAVGTGIGTTTIALTVARLSDPTRTAVNPCDLLKTLGDRYPRAAPSSADQVTIDH